jgi:tetratricopeptide (TPR) repeat protein
MNNTPTLILRRLVVGPLALLASTLALAPSCLAQTPPPTQAPAPDETLERLRADYAMRFMEPEPHMALAKYFRDRGDRLEAFYILETARRTNFDEEEFDAAFRRYFLGEKPFDNGKEAESKLLADLARDPDSHDALMSLADIYISREEYAKAKQYLSRLVRLHPEHFEDAQALAEVYRREGDEAAAEKILAEWARLHPETAEAYRLRASQFSEKESAAAEAFITEASRKFPRDAAFPFALAGLRLRQNRPKEAGELYERAAALAPDSDSVQAWVGRFYFKAGADDRRALDHYLSAYLRNPHAYETEFVESRIPVLHTRLAEASFREQSRRGVPPDKMLADPDPFVVITAFKEMGKSWRPEYFKTLVGLMSRDDESVRWEATQMLKEKADASFDATLDSLLQDGDLRRRGLAAYVAVHRRGRRSFEQMRRMLAEDAQLLRFDAISALVLEGGPEGRKLALEHAPRETHPKLKKLIEKLKEDRPPQ